MYQGLRMLGGLLVVFGLIFPVGVVVYLVDSGPPYRIGGSRDSLHGWAAKVIEDAGGDAQKVRDLEKQEVERFAREDVSLRQFQAISLFGLVMLDLAVLGLGLGLRAIADMADRLSRVSYKKPAGTSC